MHFLDDDAVGIDGVRFLGSTLWSDFRLAPTTEAPAAALAEARAQIRDFSRIRRDDDGPAPFTP